MRREPLLIASRLLSRKRARIQWQGLHEALASWATMKLIVPQPGLPDLVITANAPFGWAPALFSPASSTLSTKKRNPHLDTWFCKLSDGTLLDDSPALDGRSNRLMAARVNPETRLALAEADAHAFACIAVNGAKTVILNQTSAALRQRLESRGFEVVQTPLGEIPMAGDPAKGLTLRLRGVATERGFRLARRCMNRNDGWPAADQAGTSPPVGRCRPGASPSGNCALG